MLVEDAPTLTVYVPASATQAALDGSKEARSADVRVKVSVCDWPGCNRPVLAKALHSDAGLLNLSAGALM